MSGEGTVTLSAASMIEHRVADLLTQMTLEEKVGQLQQLQGSGGHVSEHLRQAIREGRVGSVLNEVDRETVNTLQWIATTESRLRIPLLVGRDVIHGFHTVFPIPLGQAASWNPALVSRAARIAAAEAAAVGINWSFAPMIDIGRDPRWGRVAEGFGEDPYLTGVMGAAVVRGFQGDDLAAPGYIAACAKHFAGYGACESGRDYNTTNVAENELRNVHLPPFRAAIDAGAASLMTSFSDIDGVPASANQLLLQTILRDEWGYDGLVVSDWESIRQLAVHGLTGNDRDSAREAALAGVDMEMASTTYADHLVSLVHEGQVPMARVDQLVANVLRLKFRLGLFEAPYADEAAQQQPSLDEALQVAREAARESVVLLRNEPHRDHPLLPLSPDRVQRLAVIGPLADDAYEQLGTWIFDGDAQRSVTILNAIRARAGASMQITYARGVDNTRSRAEHHFDEAIAVAAAADVAVVVLGEEAILSGEAHCRADITLPGAQQALLSALSDTGTPIVLVILAGRALALEHVVSHAHALLYAWHPGCMGGPALADILFGDVSPSGHLPVTLPRVTGQIPMYYGHKHTGKPPTRETVVHMEQIEARAPQLSVGNTSFHLDVAHTPLFPFGFGLSYARFECANISTSDSTLTHDGVITISADVSNVGDCAGDAVVQLYIRDVVANVTRPVRELKRFTKVHLAPGERSIVRFALTPDDLAFYGRAMQRMCEPGMFHAWIGLDATTDLFTEFVHVA
ncbi:MAG: beta-glucosidase BglX [Gemmatimonadaceae bacterium]|nr:beta-glucosidase BglX [Gemmatimonadaceae bacterium]